MSEEYVYLEDLTHLNLIRKMLTDAGVEFREFNDTTNDMNYITTENNIVFEFDAETNILVDLVNEK